MRKTTQLSALVILLVTASSSLSAQNTTAPATPPAIDPVGMYDFDATMGIESRTGTLELERNAEGQLIGEAWLDGESDPAIIESGVVTGNHVDLYAFVSGQNPITFSLEFEGTDFEGTIAAGANTIEVIGRRRP